MQAPPVEHPSYQIETADGFGGHTDGFTALFLGFGHIGHVGVEAVEVDKCKGKALVLEEVAIEKIVLGRAWCHCAYSLVAGGHLPKARKVWCERPSHTPNHFRSCIRFTWI